MTNSGRVGGVRPWLPAVMVVAGLAASLIVLDVVERGIRTEPSPPATPSSAPPREPVATAGDGASPSTRGPEHTARATDQEPSAAQSSPGSSVDASPQLQGPATNGSSVSDPSRREAEERERREAEERERREAEERGRREAEERGRREAEERERQDAQRQLEAAAHEYAARVTPDVARAAANVDLHAEARSQYYAESSRCWNDDSLEYIQKLEQCGSRASAAYDAFIEDPGSYPQERYDHWYPQYYEAYYWDFIRYHTRR